MNPAGGEATAALHIDFTALGPRARGGGGERGTCSFVTCLVVVEPWSGGRTRYHAQPQLYGHVSSRRDNARTEHVGPSPTRKAGRACTKREPP